MYRLLRVLDVVGRYTPSIQTYLEELWQGPLELKWR